MSVDTLTSLDRLPLDELVRRASAAPFVRDEAPLAARAAAGDLGAKERLVAVHLRDVVDEAIANRGGGVPVDRLVRRGLDGLVAAAEQYDPGRHPSFGPFARRCIRREVRASLLARSLSE